MIEEAQKAGCSIVKFQKRTPRLQFSPEKYNAPHPSPQNAFGKTYGEHRENLEFSIDIHKELMEYAQNLGIDYSSSVFDIVSTKEIISINPKHIKIPSPINNKCDIIECIAKNFNGIIHVSLGMTTKKEEKELITILKKHNKLKNTVLYHCVSAYPTQNNDASLLEITRLKETYSNQVLGFGFSSHHTDLFPSCIALALGATYIEHHITFNKNAKGSDHKISIDYEELKYLTNSLKKTESLLTYKEKEILDCELEIRKFHKENNMAVINNG